MFDCGIITGRNMYSDKEHDGDAETSTFLNLFGFDCLRAGQPAAGQQDHGEWVYQRFAEPEL